MSTRMSACLGLVLQFLARASSILISPSDPNDIQIIKEFSSPDSKTPLSSFPNLDGHWEQHSGKERGEKVPGSEAGQCDSQSWACCQRERECP